MKRLLLFAILLLVANNAFSQLEVNPGSFKETIGFVNTNPDPDYQYDDNDLPFAVIKVRTENISDRQRRELIFEGNAGTFIMLEYKIGEVWVYLTAKYADYIKISHPELSSCEFTLPCDLLAKHGYEMTLVNKTANSSGSGTLIVTTKPENGATVTLNGKVQEQPTPYKNSMIAVGHYEVTVAKERYKTITKIIDIQNDENVDIEIEMPLDIAVITVTADVLTSVYIDGNFKKYGTWSGELYSGSHEIVGKKNNHYDAKQLIIVEAAMAQTYKLDPVPIIGAVSIESNPAGLDVFIDNKKCGVTPLVLNDIVVGQHELKIKKENCRTLIKKINVSQTDTLYLNETLEILPEGAINGAFSVGPDKRVLFSQGNLQYQASTDTWRFAEHQWDVVGSGNNKISPTYSGWIDLFGWGTSGYKKKMPYETSEKGGSYCCRKSISGTKYDWGVYNTISNGNGKNWRTLTQKEWNYILYIRETKSGVRYIMAKVNNVCGVVLLPDDWDSCFYSIKPDRNYYEANIINEEDWINVFEANGAIFLPGTGSRSGNVYYYYDGHYWSATMSNRYLQCYYLRFNDMRRPYVNDQATYFNDSGFAVRLVRDVD